MRRILVFMAIVLVSVTVWGRADAGGQQTEATMVVAAKMRISAAGDVESFALDGRDALPEGVARLLERQVPAWKFKPVLQDGVPTPVGALAHIRVRARPREDGRFNLEVVGATFGDEAVAGGLSLIELTDDTRPRYPVLLQGEGVAGIVYLFMEVSREGRVTRVATEQVNLTQYPRHGPSVVYMRDQLARAALKAVERWTFTTPTRGELAGDPYWNARVPVVFRPYADSPSGPGYGQWEAYLPGPRTQPDWIAAGEGGSDALPPDTISLVDPDAPQLLTQLGGR
ncbi:hypothetical protein H4F99_04285 [Lysobacter sp. SG-8]|uniref:Protein tonB n=1 Tax=Marilutibacter penaei TaxID=2759900 RepID=A0A7W3U2E8_9GAMM|nr:hypothetical protein [Lysobacter penaei]MBB1087702.1 hypothetical protein [Lysobacter penaei]